MLRFSSSPRLLAYGCLASSMALVGSYVALSKPLAAVFPVLLLAWLRFGIGALAMLHWLKRPPHEPPMTRQTRWLLFWESFLGNFLFTLCMISGVRLSGAVAAGVIMAAIPAAVALLSWVLLRERVAPQVWAGVASAVLGIGLLATAPDAASPAQQAMPRGQWAWLGHLLLLGAVLCEASYAVIGKKLTASLTPRRISALINLWGFVLSLPFGLWLAWGFDFRTVGPGLWLLLVFYALAACMWTVWLWMTGLRSVPAAQAGVFTVFLPISAALVGVLVLGERMAALQWAALGLALLGVVLATWPARGPSPA
ncbi:DMT family transporter [Vandammella animalimorsus]|uniref:EamA family transporter n=2 Tax=Vandammella animalimorsus TaxID=2029117 RepID=A0A2A2ACT5_9BURK|nr:DMT family transporter [Vandammella animalimorsus]PAT35603.1 EamA family transporter [Vandammella animalimorsus]